MLSTLIKIYNNLDKQDKYIIFYLQLATIVMSLFEIMTILIIGPFVAILGDLQNIENIKYIKFFYDYFPSMSHIDFLKTFSFFVLTIFIFTALVNILTTWLLSIYSQKIGVSYSKKLFAHYLNKDWNFHYKNNSNFLVNKIASECGRVTNGIIQPTLFMISRIILILFIFGVLFYNNPNIVILISVIFGFSYFFIYLIIKKNLNKKGEQISMTQGYRYKFMSEALGGIKEIILLGRKDYFIKEYNKVSDIYALASGKIQAISIIPRYFLELVAIIITVTLISFSIGQDTNILLKMLPVIAIFCLAGVKLLPAFQTIYSAFVSIKSHLPAYNSIKEDIQEANLIRQLDKKKICSNKFLDLKKGTIELKNVYFEYSSRNIPVVKNLNLKFDLNSTIGIVGKTGSGKSTILDLLMGLLEPKTGHLIVNNNKIDKILVNEWQKEIAYVPQNIFLKDRSIRENIAFGIHPDKINEEKISEVIKICFLNELIDKLDNKSFTSVGERGIKLSGGQRQRIALARALYSEKKIIVLDEATSALDSVTENSIINSINALNKEKTVLIVTHRINTIQRCKKIFFVKDGRIICEGSYNYLIDNCSEFKDMANK